METLIEKSHTIHVSNSTLLSSELATYNEIFMKLGQMFRWRKDQRNHKGANILKDIVSDSYPPIWPLICIIYHVTSIFHTQGSSKNSRGERDQTLNNPLTALMMSTKSIFRSNTHVQCTGRISILYHCKAKQSIAGSERKRHLSQMKIDITFPFPQASLKPNEKLLRSCNGLS